MRCRSVLAPATAAVALLAFAPAATAQSSGANGPGFAVAAVGFESYFRYTMRPGDVRRGRIRVTTSGRSQTVVVRAADVTTAATGGLDYGTRPPSGVGRWIRLGRRAVTVPAGRSIEVPFTLRVPAGTAPGDHLAGLVAVDRAQLRKAQRRRGKDGFSLRFLPRLAIAVSVTVPGKAARELRVGNVGVDVSPTTTDVTLLIRNTGARLIRRTRGRLTVRRGNRVLLRRKVALDAFVPGTEITYRLPLTGVPARGAYRLTGELRPEGAGSVRVDGTASFEEKQARELEEETGREPVSSGPSTLMLLLVAAAVAALVGMAWALLRTRRRLRAAEAAARAPRAGRPD